MSDRNLEFKAYFPQLQNDPGKFRGGVKRYNLRKNEDSPGFVMGGSSNSLVNSSLLESSNRGMGAASLEPGSDRSLTSFSPLPKLYSDNKTAYSIRKLPVNGSVSSDYYSLMNHPAFRQPSYTKLRPKIVNNNPIVGYSSRDSYSPEPFGAVFKGGLNRKSINKYLY